MQKGIWTWIYVIIFIFMFFLLVLNLCDKKVESNKEQIYMLKNIDGLVTLYEGEKVIAKYDDIVVGNLPVGDRTALTQGIEFETFQEAQSALEDYDG